jgi:hypothetical protein
MTAYNVKPTANRKYVRDLLKRLPKGYRIGMVEEASDGTRPARPINKTHPNVLTPNGELLTMPNGRYVTVANTSGDSRGLLNDLKMIERAIGRR